MPTARAMKSYCAQHSCDFGVMLGDNIYPDGAMADADDARRFRDVFTTPYGSLVEGRDSFKIYGVLGNHDWHTSRDGALAQVRFLETTPPFFMNGLFYRAVPAAADGDIEIFALDTQVLLAATRTPEAVLAEDASELQTDDLEYFEPWAAPQNEAERNMVQWLEASLASSKARWKIVIGHHPLWSTAGSKFQQAKSLRRLILPALCRYADLYLAGHEHTLEVHTDGCTEALPGSDVTPLPQVVSGSASKMRPTNSAFIGQQLKAHPELRTLYARGLAWGFAHLTFEGDRATVRLIETPRDGSGTAQVNYEHSFTRRSSSGPESTP
jgi:tartrate-resistant acid phosphatase type 5